LSFLHNHHFLRSCDLPGTERRLVGEEKGQKRGARRRKFDCCFLLEDSGDFGGLPFPSGQNSRESLSPLRRSSRFFLPQRRDEEERGLSRRPYHSLSPTNLNHHPVYILGMNHGDLIAVGILIFQNANSTFS
jgi:hypothetical protein